MTAAALLAAQAAIHASLQTRAIELGYDRAKVEPIYDGVVDAAGYLAAKPKVMWILKEPYDDFDADGNPQGGKRLLWVPHPAARIPPGEWVEAVVAAGK